MAITNAQQYKQLVNPPMKGNKRPGYRGVGGYGGGVGGGAAAGGGLGEGPASGGGSGGGGDRGDKREQRSVASTLGISPTTQSQLGIDRSAVGQFSQYGKNVMNQSLDSLRPAFGFTDAARTNLLSPSSIAKTAFGALIGIPGLGFLSNIRVNPNPPTTTTTTGGGGDEQGPVPYWAQLGFSSEAEYLAALARAQAPSTKEPEPEVEEPFQLARRFRAEGGIMNSDVVGGEFDFESARQMYGLGKLVKKVTRTVKKIAKSPIGKAALLYTGAGALGNLAAGTGLGGAFTGFTSPTSFLAKNKLAGIFSRAGAKNILFGASPISMGGNRGVGQGIMTKGTSGLFGFGGELSPLKTITAASTLAGLLTPEQEEEAQELSRGEGIDIEAARNAILAARQDDFRARRFRAEGGSMKEPVAKKTMPLLDMGGQEMDLRAEGGFVPIGRMEKADDVPARLSKNEFVFTADAVRNAGDGDVDKGAEVMYNMMKNLEAGGEVSEESQGLEGARKMFQTSQRLEEVL